MAIRKITIYECDLCKRKVDKQGDLTRINLPEFDNEEFISMNDVEIDCCNDCIEKIAKLLANKIGYYDTEKDEIVVK